MHVISCIFACYPFPFSLPFADVIFLCKFSIDLSHPLYHPNYLSSYVHLLRTSAVFSFYYVFFFFFLFSGLPFPLKIHTFSSFLPAAFFCFHLSFLFILSQTDSFLPHPFPTSTPSVGKWHAVKVPEWTDSHHGGVALLGPNSLAPVAMWTCSHPLPRQQHLPRSPPNTSIRKMGKPSLNASLPREVHSRDRQDVKLK